MIHLGTLFLYGGGESYDCSWDNLWNWGRVSSEKHLKVSALFTQEITQHSRKSHLAFPILFHKIVATIEAVPALGIIVVLIELVIAKTVYPIWLLWIDLQRKPSPFARWHAEPIPSIEGKERPESSQRSVFGTLCSTASTLGSKPSQEDVLFTLESGWCTFAAVFDGHGGSQVSSFSSIWVQNFIHQHELPFFYYPQETLAFMVDSLEKEIENHPEFNLQGSTLLLSVINRYSNTITTCTVGDSEAVLFSTESHNLYNLSKVINWDSVEEQDRLIQAQQNGVIARKKSGHKTRIYSSPIPSAKIPFRLEHTSTNLSRSMGDIGFDPANQGVISHQPTLSQSPFHRKHQLLLASDGLFDYLSKEELKELLIQQKTPQEIVAAAILKMSSNKGDNISVILITFTSV